MSIIPVQLLPLTSDNLLISATKTETQLELLCNSQNAINCTLELSPAIATYVQASLSINTRKAYLSPWCDGLNAHIKYFCPTFSFSSCL